MITGQAWDLFIEMLSSIYDWADSKILVDFAGYQLSFAQIWLSFCIVVLFLECIIAPVFAGRIFFSSNKSKYNKNNRKGG